MESWNKLSTLLLETNNIQIPIEKRFFLSFLDDDTETIQISKVLNKIEKMGFLKDDPRLMTVRRKIKSLFPSTTMKYEEFKYCIENNICIFNKILKHELIIPDFESFTHKIKKIYESTKEDKKILNK